MERISWIPALGGKINSRMAFLRKGSLVYLWEGAAKWRLSGCGCTAERESSQSLEEETETKECCWGIMDLLNQEKVTN